MLFVQVSYIICYIAISYIAVQYLDVALAAVLCNIAQVPAANASTTPHLIGGKTLDYVLKFLYNLTCGDQLWQQMSFQR